MLMDVVKYTNFPLHMLHFGLIMIIVIIIINIIIIIIDSLMAANEHAKRTNSGSEQTF